jgi:hypothetical protein
MGSPKTALMSNMFLNLAPTSSYYSLFTLRSSNCREGRCCTRCAASPTCRRCRRASSRPWSGSCARILPRWSASPGTSRSSRSGSPTTGTIPPLLSKRGYYQQCCVRIRDVYPGSDFFPSQIRTVSIPDPGFSSKNLSILTPKKQKMVSKL